MTSLENMSFLQNDTIPLHEKAYIIKSFLVVQSDLVDLYTNIRMKKQYYNRELVYLYIFELNITQKMLDLGNEINESEVPADIAMQSGYS